MVCDGVRAFQVLGWLVRGFRRLLDGGGCQGLRQQGLQQLEWRSGRLLLH